MVAPRNVTMFFVVFHICVNAPFVLTYRKMTSILIFLKSLQLHHFLPIIFSILKCLGEPVRRHLHDVCHSNYQDEVDDNVHREQVIPSGIENKTLANINLQTQGRNRIHKSVYPLFS